MDVAFWAIIIVGVCLGFFIQAVAGFSGNLIAIPILLYVLDIKEIVAITSFLLVVFSVVLVWNNRKDIDVPTVRSMGLFTAIGVIAGVLLLKAGSPLILKRVLGVTMLLYALHALLYTKPIPGLQRAAIPISLLGGVFSGMFATGGGLYVMYLDTRFKRKEVMRATLLAVLGINNLIRFPLLAANGVLTVELFKVSLIVLPFFLVAIWLGQRAYKLLDPAKFRLVTLCLLVVGGVLLTLS